MFNFGNGALENVEGTVSKELVVTSEQIASLFVQVERSKRALRVWLKVDQAVGSFLEELFGAVGSPGSTQELLVVHKEGVVCFLKVNAVFTFLNLLLNVPLKTLSLRANVVL